MEGLPSEIWIQVADELSVKDVLNLSLTCHAMHELILVPGHMARLLRQKQGYIKSVRQILRASRSKISLHILIKLVCHRAFWKCPELDTHLIMDVYKYLAPSEEQSFVVAVDPWTTSHDFENHEDASGLSEFCLVCLRRFHCWARVFHLDEDWLRIFQQRAREWHQPALVALFAT